MLRNRHELPPGGFIYFEARTNWPPNPENFFAGMDFDRAVAAIIQHRQSNPRYSSDPEWSTDPGTVAKQLDEFTCIRLANNPFFCLGGSSAKKAFSPQGRLAGQVAAFAGAVKGVVGGVGAWLQWVGPSGRVADHSLAEARAEICSTCPQNVPGGLLAFFSIPASELIKEQLEIKTQMQLTTRHDQKLNVCKACLCPLHLKVWAELSFALENLKPESKEKLDPRCWMLKEKA